eukprot:13545788-Alexandrium_andersonii.AAC.1
MEGAGRAGASSSKRRPPTRKDRPHHVLEATGQAGAEHPASATGGTRRPPTRKDRPRPSEEEAQQARAKQQGQKALQAAKKQQKQKAAKGGCEATGTASKAEPRPPTPVRIADAAVAKTSLPKPSPEVILSAHAVSTPPKIFCRALSRAVQSPAGSEEPALRAQPEKGLHTQREQRHQQHPHT